jgi:hypothetical protein
MINLTFEEIAKYCKEYFEEMLKIIDLKYSGIVASDSRILKQEEGEKLDNFIERLKRLS